MEHLWVEDNATVNDISQEQLAEFIGKFAPLCRGEDGGEGYFTMVIPNLRRTAYLWDPKRLDEVKFESLYQIKTVHSCGYYGFFKPSIAEVFAALLDHSDIINDGRVNAFWLDNQNLIEIHKSGSYQNAVTHFGHYSQEI